MACRRTPCRNWLGNTVRRTRIGGFPIKYTSDGRHFYVVRTPFKQVRWSTFARDCDRAIRNLDYFARKYGGLEIAWIGHVGTVATNRCTWHRSARAWDINRVQWTKGVPLDIFAGAHRSRYRRHRRRYLATDAVLRKFFGNVYDGYLNAAHANHFHVDDGCPVAPLSPRRASHTVFIQQVCNEFNFAGIAVDGVWGPITEGAWRALRLRLGLGGTRIRSDVADYRLFLTLVAKHGFRDVRAGHYRAKR